MTLAPKPPILYTERCRLDRITLHDVDMLRDIVEDFQFRICLPELYELVQNVDGMYRFLSSFDTYAQNVDGFLWGIWKQNYLIGFVAIMDMSYNPTIFYAVHPEYRNKGYGQGSGGRGCSTL
jgi:RimJ/RimL family protein N-acetyltransferase